MAAAQLDFERFFGPSENTFAKMGNMGGEQVIIVENHIKRAFYSLDIALLKVINLTGIDE